MVRKCWKLIQFVALLAMAAMAMGPTAYAQASGKTFNAFLESAMEISGLEPIKGRLPDITEIPAAAPSSIDGIYTISTIKKRIQLEGGRAYAVDGWSPTPFTRIKPNMVTSMNLIQTGAGTFELDDISLMGRGYLTVEPSGEIDVKTKGAIPYNYRLIPVIMKDHASPSPDPDDCTPVYDADADTFRCATE